MGWNATFNFVVWLFAAYLAVSCVLWVYAVGWLGYSMKER